jgi:hypothetical protein
MKLFVILLFSFLTSCLGLWTQVSDYSGDVFTARSGHTSVLSSGDTAVIYGGHFMHGYSNPVQYFQNEIWTYNNTANSLSKRIVTGLVPSNRTFHGAVALDDGSMLTWGGGKIVGFSFVAADTNIWIYHVNTQSWESIVPAGSVFPTGRLAHGLARHGDQVILFGGVVPKTNGQCCDFLNDMYSYSISANEWTQLSPSGTTPSPRSHMGFLTIGDAIWLQGGEGTNFAIEKGLWRYRFNKDQWLEINEENPDIPNQRESQMFAHVGNTIVIFAGDTEGPNFYNLRNDTQTYSIQDDVWVDRTSADHPPKGKRMPSVAFSTGEVMFFGENTDLNPFTGVEQNNNQFWKFTL